MGYNDSSAGKATAFKMGGSYPALKVSTRQKPQLKKLSPEKQTRNYEQSRVSDSRECALIEENPALKGFCQKSLHLEWRRSREDKSHGRSRGCEASRSSSA